MFPARRPTAEYAEIAEKNFLSLVFSACSAVARCPLPISGRRAYPSAQES